MVGPSRVKARGMSIGNSQPQRSNRAGFSLVGAGDQATLDAPIQFASLGPLELELGGHLEQVTLAYRTWGTLNADRSNAIIVLHALTGDSRAAGPNGWWEPLIGPGLALDTDKAFVICSNILGGCQGSTGPSSADPLTGRPYAMRFPLITIGDMVNAQRKLIEHLGIQQVIAVGGSIGGFQALDWATRHADLVRATSVVAASEHLDSQGIAMNEIGRRAIMADPDWRGGNYLAEGVVPKEGLAIARMVGMVTYHSKDSMTGRFGRTAATRPTLYPSFGSTFDVEGYLHYHGIALVNRFDANSYLYLTRAMDQYALGRDGGEAYWLEQVRGPMQFVGISSDWLFPRGPIVALTERAAMAGIPVSYGDIYSPDGHDAFLKEWDQMTAVLKPFIDANLPEVAT